MLLNSFIANALSIGLLIFVIASLFMLKNNSPTGIRQLKADIRELEKQLDDSEWWCNYWAKQWEELHIEMLKSDTFHICDICIQNKKKGK